MPTERGIAILPVGAVEAIASRGNGIEIWANRFWYRKRQGLRELGSLLDPARFIRIHRTRIVNIDHVTTVVPLHGGDGIVILGVD